MQLMHNDPEWWSPRSGFYDMDYLEDFSGILDEGVTSEEVNFVNSFFKKKRH